MGWKRNTDVVTHSKQPHFKLKRINGTQYISGTSSSIAAAFKVLSRAVCITNVSYQLCLLGLLSDRCP
jgi:hypothetical protein